MHPPSDGPAVSVLTADSRGARFLTAIDSIYAGSSIVVFEAPRSDAPFTSLSVSSLNAGYVYFQAGSGDRYIAANSFASVAIDAGLIERPVPPLVKRALDDLHTLATRASAPQPVVNVHAERGPQGHQGVAGPQGAPGPRGHTGDQGPQGVPGPQGPKGEEGLSAYEVAVSRGFKGSEAEWIQSLQGKDGLAGPRGPRGRDGATVVSSGGVPLVTSVNSMVGDVTIEANSIAFGVTYVSSAFETKYTVSSAVTISGTGILIAPNSGTGAGVNLTTIGNVGNNLFAQNFRDASFSPSVTLRHDRGNPSSPSPLITNDALFTFGGQGRYGTGANDVANGFGMTSRVIASAPSSADFATQFLVNLIPPSAGITQTEALRMDHVNGLQLFGANVVIDAQRILRMTTVTLSTMPLPSPAGKAVYVSNPSTGRPTLAWASGSEWLTPSSVALLG